jgi:hypothetical protein
MEESVNGIWLLRNLLWFDLLLAKFSEIIMHILSKISVYDSLCSRALLSNANHYVINLVDPASSHTLVSKIKPCMSKYKQFIQWNCEWLIISVIVYSIIPYYLDIRSNSRANTCLNTRLFTEGLHLLDWNQCRFRSGFELNHNNVANRSFAMNRMSFCPISFGW